VGGRRGVAGAQVQDGIGADYGLLAGRTTEKIGFSLA
jgi:hypothetical protein